MCHNNRLGSFLDSSLHSSLDNYYSNFHDNPLHSSLDNYHNSYQCNYYRCNSY